MMTSRSAPTDVLFTRIFVIPNDVSFTFFRKTNGEQYITCVPIGGASNIPLIISVEEFLKIIDSLEAWIKAEYVSSVTSSLDEIRGDSLSGYNLSLIHISEPTRLLSISYAVFCLKKKKKT